MIKKRLLSAALAVTMCGSLFTGTIVSAAPEILTVDATAAADGTTSFNTIHEAVAKAKEINPKSENDRVTINVNPGTYEEQVIIDGVNYVTLQQTPGTEGKVNLNWYYCTGYAASNCDVDGSWQPGLDWTKDETWVDPSKKIELGKAVPAGTTLEYKVGGETKKYTAKSEFYLGDTGRSYGGYLMAALIVQNGTHDITVKDFNIVNSVPVMVTQGQKDAHLVHTDGFPNLPDRYGDELTVCAEDTPEQKPSEFSGQVNIDTYRNLVKTGRKFNAGESAWLTRSSAFNERGHAVSLYGDRITLENVRLRGNQDSLYICNGRDYFKNCDVIGGTDYIYGSATAVFDHCRLGLAGNSDRVYGSPIATAQTPTTTPYGYLFYNCTLYNIRDNGGEHNFGGSWNSNGQVTYYNCVLDDTNSVGKSAFKLADKGWGRFNAEQGLHRLYEYGTTNNSGKTVDLSKRVVNKSVEEGGPGMGTVIDEWQALEFNPRNYFAAKNTNKNWSDDWDPMDFAKNYTKIDEAIESVKVTIPSNEETTFALPAPPDGIEYKWESSSPNAVVSADGKSITVIRPASGEASIESEVILYVRDSVNTEYGDKVTIPVTITPTTNTTDVFNMPVNITTSTALNEAYDYNITISRSGAVIKQAKVTMPAGQTAVSGKIENIPASESGIDYDVKVIATSDQVTITAPENGAATVVGKTGTDVELNIVGQMQVDKNVELKDALSYSADGGAKTSYDLIDLAKNAGADDSVSTSDSITVEYDLTVPGELSQSASYIDLIATTPAANITTGAVNSRFAFWRIYKGWTQIDMADGAGGFSGTSNTDNQWLNIAGKFDYKTTNHITTTIDYKNQVVSAKATGSGSYQSVKEFTFASFPTNYSKGSLYLAMYPAGADVWSVDNVTVTYKSVVSDDPTKTPAPATPTPEVTQAPEPTATPGGEVSGENMFVVDADTPTAAGTVYTDNENIRVEGEFATAIGAVATTIEGKSFTHSLAVRVDGKDPDKGEYIEKSGTTPLHITAKRSGSFKIYYRRQCSNNTANSFVVADGKDIKLSKKNASGYDAPVAGVWTMSEATNEGMYAFGTQVFTIEAGSEYLLWARGTTGTLLGYEFIPDGGEVTPTTPPVVDPTTPPTAAPTPTIEVTTPPTEAPTPTATAVPTEAPTPDTTMRIVSAAVDNGSTIVKLANISDGVLIGAAYDDDGVLTSIKFKDITGDDMTLEGIEADEVYVWDSISGMKPVCEAKAATDVIETEAPATDAPVTDAPATDAPATATPTALPSVEAITVDFTTMSAVPVYSAENGQGFVSTSGAIMPDAYKRKVAPVSEITIGANGAQVTESNGNYLYNKSSDDYNYGGLIYRVDTGAPGAYHLEVEVASAGNTWVNPTGTQGSRLISTSNWDNCNNVPRTVSAKWNGNVWSYDFGTGEDFIEIEIEPNALPTAAKAQTVGVKSIKITPLAVNEKGDKPTIHILGDSTQKTYSFNETISSWGQTLGNYFDKDKVNVINYSMGGRAMKSNYNEGRFDEILIRGKKGDFVFIHSAHNDETVSTGRYVRGASVGNNLADNNANYNVWLDMYIKAIKARGMTPVLVTAMPRNAGLPTENADKPNGFNPDSPGMMRAKAASDPEVGFVELYAGAKEYFTKLERNEGIYIYNYLEAGETPAENAANGTNSDGTHYREAAAKQFCRIMLQSIYDQANASTDTYNDKAIMDELLSYMPESVVSAAETKDWSAVFPEMASDVSAVDVVPGAAKQSSSNYYYRTAIEKVLQLGALHKDAENNFKPTQTITVGEFARGMETVFGLAENSLTSYTKTYAEIQAEGVKPAELSISAADEAVIATASDTDIMTADAEGDLTVTVEQPVGGKVTIYNESQHAAETLDFTTSITSKQVIDREYFTFTAPEVIVSNTDKSGAYAENTAISTGYIETAQTSSITNKFAMYEAKASGTLTVYLRFDASKPIKLENTGNGNVQQTYINDALVAGSGNVYGTVHFNVEAGETYKFYSQGGTSRVFGMMFEAGYPQSTTSLAANSGDQIRIVASADNGYVLNSITVNGETAATTREHIITVTDNTIVSAAFDKEPEVVETTIIASDAALTREAMGAILYDAYLAAYGKNADGSWNKVAYMNQNGGVPSPDDPNYDPNIPYEGSPYTPLQGWGTLVDKDDLSLALYAKVKEAYNLGLMRSEQGIGRGSIAVGNELEPTAVVTRAKAAKTLAFCYVLTQPTSSESQIIPDNHNYAAEKAAPIITPNPEAPSTPYTTN